VFVDKAVMECENRKLVQDISQKLDTSSFDAYCAKTPFLEPYKVKLKMKEFISKVYFKKLFLKLES
jgi:hypothetical protein